MFICIYTTMKLLANLLPIGLLFKVYLLLQIWGWLYCNHEIESPEAWSSPWSRSCREVHPEQLSWQLTEGETLQYVTVSNIILILGQNISVTHLQQRQPQHWRILCVSDDIRPGNTWWWLCKKLTVKSVLSLSSLFLDLWMNEPLTQNGNLYISLGQYSFLQNTYNFL